MTNPEQPDILKTSGIEQKEKPMLNEIEKQLLKKVRYSNISANSHPILGWLWYEIDQEVLPLSREERDVVLDSRYLKFDLVFSSLLGKEVEAIRLDSEKLNSVIKKALAEDPELSWRELGLPAWYWRWSVNVIK